MAALPQIEKLLHGLPGVLALKRVEEPNRLKILEIESLSESQGLVPIKNFGVRLALKREFIYVILKNELFREPDKPTLLLVEEVAGIDDDKLIISIDQKKYKIIGEEVIAGSTPYVEEIRPIENSFVLFPNRRSSKNTPAYFILPPTAFPELEQEKTALSIGDVVSGSPSAATDKYLRTEFEFPHLSSYATLLLGFDSASYSP